MTGFHGGEVREERGVERGGGEGEEGFGGVGCCHAQEAITEEERSKGEEQVCGGKQRECEGNKLACEGSA